MELIENLLPLKREKSELLRSMYSAVEEPRRTMALGFSLSISFFRCFLHTSAYSFLNSFTGHFMRVVRAMSERLRPMAISHLLK